MIVSSQSPSVSIPDQSLPEFLLAHVAQFGDTPALIDGPGGRTYSYAQFGKLVQNVAGNLAKRGFKPGDCLAIYSANLPEYAIAFIGVALAGGVVTTVNPLYTVAELGKQLADSGARSIITLGMFADKAAEAGAANGITEIFAFDGAPDTVAFNDLMADCGEFVPPSINAATDLLVLPYSSGTTGVSKGVMLTHANVVANLIQVQSMDGFKPTTPDDTVIGVLPFFHIYGMVVIMIATLITGATVVTMPRFDMEEFLSLIEKYKVTRAPLVPPIVVGLTKHPAVDNYDLSSLQYVNSGAAPLGEEASNACSQRIGCLVTQGYGLTETSPVTHINPYDAARIKHGSAGLALPNTETKIVDVDTGESLPANQQGEVLIRGPQVMQGYLNNAQATAATIDEDGWLHTGDIGYHDDDHYLFVIDRLKELIKYKGFQVAPAELEALLLAHTSVADAAVIPVPDEDAGEIPKAFIVLKADATATVDEIADAVNAQIAPYKKIRQVEAATEIPKSLAGKILRRVLVDKERAKIADT